MSLPSGFEDLERFVPEWALATEAERKKYRVTRPYADNVIFAESLAPRILDITGHLDKFPVGELDEKNRNLLHLAYMYMEVGIAIEFYKQSELPDGFPWQRFNIVDIPRAQMGEIKYINGGW